MATRRNPPYLMRPRSRRRAGRLPPSSVCAQTAIDYLRNILIGARIAGQAAWSQAHELEDNELFIHALRSIDGRVPRVSAERPWRALGVRIARIIVKGGLKPARATPPSEPVLSNLRLLGDLVGLGEPERELLQFLIVQRLVSSIGTLTDTLGALSLLDAAEVLAAGIARSRDEVLALLAPKSRLVSSGLVSVMEHHDTLGDKVQVKSALIDVVLLPALDRNTLLAHLLPTAPPPTLALDDYTHMTPSVALAGRLIGEALRTRRPGINILLYGATGTGKTELAGLLARESGASLHVAGKEGDEGESAEPEERLASLLLGNRLLASGSSLLLFDEMEDVFERSEFAGLLGASRRDITVPSKQWLNLLLETNAVPTIWISNDVGGMDPAFLRRFSFAIEFRPLGIAQRRRVWLRHLGNASTLNATDVERLAARFTVSAGQIATALGSAKLVAGSEPDRATIEQVLAPLEKLVLGEEARPDHVVDAITYDFDAARASCDLRALAGRLAAWRASERPGMSLCLYGPPGTGKSEFVHHLARQMGRRVLVRRVSDILSKYVGESEQNIAEAFADAARDDAVLLFDEADSFLRDRRDAHQSWEVTQVNEFLQQLESYRGIVACTTNLYRGLDQASLRRFVFKIEFQFLDVPRSRMLFRSLLEPLLAAPASAAETELVERELARIANLTPGDFAIVARRHLALRDCGGAAVLSMRSLLEELRSEAKAKEGTAQSIGF